MVAGCSNGAMIAMLLAYNQDPISGRSMLEYGSPYIFGFPVSLLKVQFSFTHSLILAFGTNNSSLIRTLW